MTKIIDFAKITEHSATRQSCIHSFTQILADCQPVMGEKLFVRFLTEEYLVIYCLLMGFDESVNRF